MAILTIALTDKTLVHEQTFERLSRCTEPAVSRKNAGETQEANTEPRIAPRTRGF